MIFLEIWKLINSCSVRTILHFSDYVVNPCTIFEFVCFIKITASHSLQSQGSACGKTWSQT